MFLLWVFVLSFAVLGDSIVNFFLFPSCFFCSFQLFGFAIWKFRRATPFRIRFQMWVAQIPADVLYDGDVILTWNEVLLEDHLSETGGGCVWYVGFGPRRLANSASVLFSSGDKELKRSMRTMEIWYRDDITVPFRYRASESFSLATRCRTRNGSRHCCTFGFYSTRPVPVVLIILMPIPPLAPTRTTRSLQTSGIYHTTPAGSMSMVCSIL